MNAKVTVTSDGSPSTMYEGTLEADDNIIVWTTTNRDPTKWYRNPLQIAEVQKEKERPAIKVSKTEVPTATAPQSEHQKGTASMSKEERPAENLQKDPTSKAVLSTKLEPSYHETPWLFCSTRHLEPQRDVEMTES